ncbi:Hypothetical protein SMAX5B_007285, partial [Scophthalmus maximus]
ALGGPSDCCSGPMRGKGAEGFLEAGNMPNRHTPTPSFQTQRAGPGPTLQPSSQNS